MISTKTNNKNMVKTAVKIVVEKDGAKVAEMVLTPIGVAKFEVESQAVQLSATPTSAEVLIDVGFVLGLTVLYGTKEVGIDRRNEDGSATGTMIHRGDGVVKYDYGVVVRITWA